MRTLQQRPTMLLSPLGRYGYSYRVSQTRYYFYVAYSVALYLGMAALGFELVALRHASLHFGGTTMRTIYVLVLLAGSGLAGQIKIASQGERVTAPQPRRRRSVRLGIWIVAAALGEVFLVAMLCTAILHQVQNGLPLPASDAVIFALISAGAFFLISAFRRHRQQSGQ